MNWYLVEFSCSKQDEWVSGESIGDVRDFLQRLYAESDRYNISANDIESCTITLADELDGAGIEHIRDRLDAPNTPFRALDRGSFDGDGAIFWESRTNIAGKNSLYHGTVSAT